jgi:hypothetical protein
METLKHTEARLKELGQRVADKKTLNDIETGVIFSMSLDFIDKLVQEKSGVIFGLEQKSEGIKDYMKYAVLGRVLRLHDEAVKEGVSGSGKETVFGLLKKTVSDNLSVTQKQFTDKLLTTILNDSLRSYVANHFTSEIEKDMAFIQKASFQIVVEKTQVK